MVRFFWVVAVILLFLLASCGTAPSEARPTDTPVPPGASPTTTDSDPLVEPSKTITPVEPAIPTPEPPTSTPTPEPPTATPSPSATATSEGPTQTPTLTPTIRLLRRPTATQAFLGAQLGSPAAMRNFAHPEWGCQWMGVAGQVFDMDDTPMMDLVVEFGGELAENPVFGLAITGQTEAYGPGGYEFKLADEPIASSGLVWAQVFDLEGNAISAPTYFSTFDDCDQNLILLNFVQAYKLPTDWVYLPLIIRGER